jgi:hypothetical protein
MLSWQVSNDGYGYSNAKILTLFDGACQICTLNADVLCTSRVGFFCGFFLWVSMESQCF